MGYIEFDKEKLVNINYSKTKEILRCSRTGSFASSSLLGLNTRKYHGLFIVPQDQIDGERHVLVSNLNETLIINEMEFHLGIHQFKGGVIHPKGNKYLDHFNADVLPTYTYKVGKFHFTKELLFLSDEDRIIIKYSIIDQIGSASIQFEPLLAFRQIHRLTVANDYANTGFTPQKNGVSYCLYDHYTPVYFQASSEIDYNHEPAWHYDFEYEEELKRGYAGHEDLLNPGKINVSINNQVLYFTIGTQPIDPSEIEPLFNTELSKRTKRSSYFNCLVNAAEQFIVKRGGKTQIIAGYPWFGRWGRDTFIALPGLTLALNKPQLCKEIMDNMLSEIKDGLFPNIGEGIEASYNSVDAPLWFIRTLQQYTEFTNTRKDIWKEYGPVLKSILNAYKKGSMYNIHMETNGLIYAGGENLALTWMDAVVDGVPVTPRTGYQVEINGLWYNALHFCLDMARCAKDENFIVEWEELTKEFPAVFKSTFWSKELGYLADYVNETERNFQVRPNMVIVTSLPYCPISEKIKQLILKKALEELYTDKGLRTLSPQDPQYKGFYKGNQEERDSAYHQGTSWPWLLGPFAEGMLAVYQKEAIPFMEKMLYNFDTCMKDYGISTIAEITDGNPPYRPNGCISQAWSVGALLHIKYLIDNEKNKKKE